MSTELTPEERWRKVGPVSPDAEPIDPDWQPLGQGTSPPTKVVATYRVQIASHRPQIGDDRSLKWRWRIVDGYGLVLQESTTGDTWPRPHSASLAGRHALADLLDIYYRKHAADGWETTHQEDRHA